MSIHFRSRITNQQLKPTVITTGSGWCCSTSRVVANRTLCQGGFFILGGTNNAFCPQTATCRSTFIGTNGACCYWEKSNDIYSQVCENVDSAIDCAEKNQGLTDGLYPTFTLGGSCIEQGGSVSCGGVENLNPDQVFLDNRDANITQDVLVGYCCGDVGDCSKTLERKCSGTWAPPHNTQLYSCESDICSGILRSMTDNPRIPPVITTYELENTTNELQKVPQIGQYYQGGIYIGTFSVIKNSESTVFGNTNTGDGNPYKARSSNSFNTIGKWILIADDEDLEFEMSFNESDEAPANINVSYSDGLYNTQNNTETQLFKIIKNYKKNGFQDWYLPSQDELAFYFNNIKLDTETYKQANIKEGLYLSSTGFKLGNTQQIQSNYYNYAQTALETDTYGKVSLLNRKASAKIRLFRRIYVIDLILAGTPLFPKIPGPYKILDGYTRGVISYKGDFKLLVDCMEYILQKLLQKQKQLTDKYNKLKEQAQKERDHCTASGGSNCQEKYEQKMEQLKKDFYDDWGRTRDDYQTDLEQCKKAFRETN